MSYINKPTTQPTTRPASQSGGWGHRGSQITTTANAVIERNSNAQSGSRSEFVPLRFYVKAGTSVDLVILDTSMEAGFAFYEHNLIDQDGRYSIFEPCLKDLGVTCPMCVQGNSSYVLFLTCIALKPYTSKKGVVIPHSKMLLPVRITQFDVIRQLEESAKNEGKSLRGMILSMKRSKTDSKAPRIGEPAIGKGGRVYEIIEEDEIISLFGHDPVTSQDGNIVYKSENEDTRPYDYEKIFPRPDVTAILQRHGKGGDIKSEEEEVASPATEEKASRVLEMLLQKRKAASNKVVDNIDDDEIPF
jgi:hypothetical protein